MRKSVIIVLTVCVLFCLSPQLTAKIWEIPITVQNGHIDLGEKYAYAVPPEATIRWTCESKFIVLFEADAPFEPVKSGEPIPQFSKVKEKKVKSTALTNYPYKYTVVVLQGDDEELVLDPIIVIIPPRK